jgi:hypothetical protein
MLNSLLRYCPDIRAHHGARQRKNAECLAEPIDPGGIAARSDERTRTAGAELNADVDRES